jgi:ribosomal protein S18 acetylase RimI-like enzyme
VHEAARRATADDLDRIEALAHTLHDELRPLRGGALWADREARPEPYRDQYAALLARDDACVVVGTVDDYVVGFGAVELETLRTGATLGRVTELFVEADARDVGVGEAIAVELVAYCEARDCIGIDAFALPGHRAAKNFFERSGFTARALIMHRPRGGRP